MRRVVITGMGAVTPIGLNVEEFWNNVKKGETGFGEISYFDTTDFKAHLAAEVKGFQSPGLTWKRRMLSVWAAAWEAESEAFRLWKLPITR